MNDCNLSAGTSPEQDWMSAWDWLCRRRQHAPPDESIWHLRFHQERELPALWHRVISGRFRLRPMRIVRNREQALAVWEAEDALVLKWVSLQVQPMLPVHPRCMHVKGRGILHTVRSVAEALRSGEYAFVYRTDSAPRAAQPSQPLPPASGASAAQRALT